MYLHELATAIHDERQRAIADHARDHGLVEEAKAARMAAGQADLVPVMPLPAPPEAQCGGAQSARSGSPVR